MLALKVNHPYRVRVLVPCYQESLEIVGKTIQAAWKAELPVGVQRTIYLCDDGKSPEKLKCVFLYLLHPIHLCQLPDLGCPDPYS